MCLLLSQRREACLPYCCAVSPVRAVLRSRDALHHILVNNYMSVHKKWYNIYIARIVNYVCIYYFYIDIFKIFLHIYCCYIFIFVK